MAKKIGTLEVICGCMFSGKSKTLIKRVHQAKSRGQHVQVFKPIIDNRYAQEAVVSHNGLKVFANPVEEASQILDRLKENVTVIAIDEVQFFGKSMIEVTENLTHQGYRVIVAGLDTDFRGEPFYPMPELMAISDQLTKLEATCRICDRPANRTQRLVNGAPAHYDDPTILIGAEESYEARCRQHHVIKRR